MRSFLLFPILFACHFVAAQSYTPAQLGFEAYTLTDDTLGEINYYLTADTSSQPKPLFVYLDGSGAYPLFQLLDGGRIGSTVVLPYRELAREYRVLLISKPGVAFMDSLSQRPPPEYTERLSLNWRVGAADRIISKLVGSGEVDGGRVVVLGISEGAQVAPYVAERNDRVTHLLLFAGNGLNQLLDPIVTARLRAYCGELSQAEAQRQVDSLFVVYRDIYANPGATDRQWWGHSYLRWASFGDRAPYRVLAELDIPIYLANGSADENSVLSADYIQLEFIRRGKDNLTYRTYPGYDHQFSDAGQSKVGAVLTEGLNWLAKP